MSITTWMSGIFVILTIIIVFTGYAVIQWWMEAHKDSRSKTMLYRYWKLLYIMIGMTLVIGLLIITGIFQINKRLQSQAFDPTFTDQTLYDINDIVQDIYGVTGDDITFSEYSRLAITLNEDYQIVGNSRVSIRITENGSFYDHNEFFIDGEDEIITYTTEIDEDGRSNPIFSYLYFSEVLYIMNLIELDHFESVLGPLESDELYRIDYSFELRNDYLYIERGVESYSPDFYDAYLIQEDGSIVQFEEDLFLTDHIYTVVSVYIIEETPTGGYFSTNRIEYYYDVTNLLK